MFCMLVDFRFAFREDLVALCGGGDDIWNDVVTEFIDYFDNSELYFSLFYHSF